MNPNSKTRNNRTEERPELAPPEGVVMAPVAELPAALAEALTAAAAVMEKCDRFISILAASHREIPAALAEERELSHKIGGLEISGGEAAELRSRLSTVAAERQGHARRRHVACESLLTMETELAGARARLSHAESGFAIAIVGGFRARWAAKLQELAALQREAEQLSAALRTRIDTAVELSAPSGPALSVSLPGAVMSVGSVLDRLDDSLALCASIAQSAVFDQRHFHLCRARGLPVQVAGVFEVRREFPCASDGMVFRQGELIDSSLVGNGTLHRLLLAHQILPADLNAGHRAA
jgi:hypothetical protein